jgi:hypothetical protein
MLLCKQDVFSKEDIFLVPILLFRTSSQKPAPQRYIYIYISATLWARNSILILKTQLTWHYEEGLQSIANTINWNLHNFLECKLKTQAMWKMRDLCSSCANRNLEHTKRHSIPSISGSRRHGQCRKWETNAVVAQTEISSKRRDTRFHLFLPVFTV